MKQQVNFLSSLSFFQQVGLKTTHADNLERYNWSKADTQKSAESFIAAADGNPEFEPALKLAREFLFNPGLFYTIPEVEEKKAKTTPITIISGGVEMTKPEYRAEVQKALGGPQDQDKLEHAISRACKFMRKQFGRLVYTQENVKIAINFFNN